METKIIKAVFGGGTSTVTNKRTRTDYGQVLEFVGVDLPDTFECIFSNSATSAGVGKKQIGSAQRVLIPDEYLATGQTIYAWVLVHDSEDDGRHMYNVRIPVADMPDTSPEEPTPVEQSVISQAIAALNTAVDTTSQKAQEASDSADRAEHAAEDVEGYAERAEAAQSASESARDIALEAKVSAQASAATASEKASEAISSAATASQSAITAENASESAQEYASASAISASASAMSASQASEYASTAESKATEASGYASSASTSAQTASQKALKASQSASSASQAKTDAETAKRASETAQGLAESARDNAITAKTSAEDARNEAQEIVDGITGKVEQIDSNTERIESLEDDRYKPYAVDSASGSIASFPDGADNIPLKSCIVQIEPVQDLHGYDSPWPAGGGKNLIQNNKVSEVINGVTFTVHDDGTVTANGTASADTDFDIKNGLSLEAGSYVLSGCPAGGSVSTYRIFATNIGSDTGSSLSFTFNEAKATTVRINIKSGTAISNLLFKPMICLSSAQNPTTFAPYENICPISGWTGMEIQHDGTNLFDGEMENGDINQYTGENNGTSSSRYCSKNYIPLRTGSYYFKSPNRTGTVRVFFYDANKTFIYFTAWNVNTVNAFDLDRVRYIRFRFSSVKVDGDEQISINSPSSVTDYIPYVGQTYPITFPSEAGTVYGGALDVTKGELVVDRVQIASYNGETLPSTWISDRDVYASGTTPTIGAQVVYKLATPIHYPITSNRINSLYGQNNIWANTGDTEVEYRADVTKYISKKITEAVSALT